MTDRLQAAPPRPREMLFPPSNRVAVAALVLGLVALVVGVVPFGIGLVLSAVPAVLAILLGLAGLVRGVRRRYRVVTALVGLGLGVLTVVLWFHGYGLLW